MTVDDAGHVSFPEQGMPLIWLLGQPRLSDYLAFVETRTIGGPLTNQRELVSEWQWANDLYWELETAEAGIADTISCEVAGPELADAKAKIIADPHFRETYDSLPVSFEFVELDKLIVSQLHVEPSYLGQLPEAAASDRADQKLFQFCLPTERPMPPVSISRLASNRYLFSSMSTDLRSHEIRLLKGEDAQGMKPTGPVAGLVGVTVGFGSNLISGIRSGTRVLLQNGHHRAYALRAAGFTHCWCAIETVTRKDELRLTADEDVINDPEFYFAAKRPPLLKDFFDERFAKTLMIRCMRTEVEVEISVRSWTSTAY
jgi:hypothetical protein